MTVVHRTTLRLNRTAFGMRPLVLLILALFGWVVGAEAQEEVSGTIAPIGPPIGEVARVDAGGACIIDLVQRYEVEGSLSGALEANYRIFVEGPCGSPPGTFHEEWIAYGTFEGNADGAPSSSNFWYRAEVATGGRVEGTLRLEGDVQRELVISGRFSDGRLSYSGRRSPRN